MRPKSFKVQFVNIGRGKATFEASLAKIDYSDLLRCVRPHLASRGIDFTIDDEARCGVVHAGMHDVGSFTWACEAEDSAALALVDRQLAAVANANKPEPLTPEQIAEVTR